MLTEIKGKPVRTADFQVPEGAAIVRPRPASPATLRGRTFVTALIWIALNVSYYGLFLWLPFVLQSEKSFSSTCTCC